MVLKPFSDLIPSKSTILSPFFNGKPEDIVAVGKLLNFVNLRRKEVLPVKTFTSIFSS